MWRGFSGVRKRRANLERSIEVRRVRREAVIAQAPKPNSGDLADPNGLASCRLFGASSPRIAAIELLAKYPSPRWYGFQP